MSLNSSRFDTYQSNRQWELSKDFYKSQNSQSERTWKNLKKKNSSDDEMCHCPECSWKPQKVSAAVKNSFDPYPWNIFENPNNLPDEEVWRRIKILEQHPAAPFPPARNLYRAKEKLDLYWHRKIKMLPPEQRPETCACTLF